MLHMNMDWFMLIGEEIKDESEVFKIFGISSVRYCNGKYKRKKPHEQVFALKSSVHRPIGVLKKR